MGRLLPKMPGEDVRKRRSGLFNLQERFCCRFAADVTMRNHLFNLKLQMTATTDAVPRTFPERPSAPEIERIVVGFRMIDYPAVVTVDP